MDGKEEPSVRRFNKWAGSYDTGILSVFFRMCNGKICQLVEPRDGIKLLDVGCGTGSLLESLFRSGRQVNLCGINVSPEMIRVARKKLNGKERVELHEGSATNSPFESDSFDYVVCANSLHHHPDPGQSLAEMTRVLKPGGVVIVMDAFIDSRVRKIFFRIVNVFRGEGKVQHFRRQELQRILHNLGHESVTQRTYLLFLLITCGTKSKTTRNPSA